MTTVVSAPCRVVLSGEYFALYGAPIIAIAVDRYVRMTVEPLPGEIRVDVQSDLGKGTVYPDGRIDGQEFVRMYVPIVSRMIEKLGLTKGYKVKIKVPDVFQGMGLSSAICACFTKAVYHEEGKDIDEHELFDYTVLGDAVVHKVKPIGIDAATVISGKQVRAVRTFGEKIVNTMETTDYEVPKGTEFLIIDTYKGKRSDKGALTLIFSRNYNIDKNPEYASEEDRKRVVDDFLAIEREVVEQLDSKGDPVILGRGLNEIHELLRKGGIVTNDVERVREIALKEGAFGTKISGAGGEGALVLVYCSKKDSGRILERFKKFGFKGIKVKPARHGVKILS